MLNGLTIHRLVQLPVEHGGIGKYPALSNDKLAICRNDFKRVALLILDEASMIPNITLAYMNQRMIEICDTAGHEDGYFGRINILFFGDLLQLEPVNGQQIFADISSDLHSKHFSSLATINLWKEIFSYDELTQNVRQKSDQEYAKALANIRLGVITEDDFKMLQNRVIDIPQNSTIPECLEGLSVYISKLPKNTICLFPKRAQCAELNKKLLDEIPGPSTILKANDEIEAKTTKQKENALKSLKRVANDNRSTHTAGLEDEIEIKVGTKVMLLRNIDVSSGLVNSAIGSVKKIHTNIFQKKNR